LPNSLVLITVIIATATFSGYSKAKQKPVDWETRINSAIDDELLNSGTPSLQIAISKKGRVIFQATKGTADIENNVLATDKSKYRIGSVSKWFTSSVAKALVEKGVLDVNIPIQKYCPQFPKKQWDITTNDLLAHKSGIRHYIDYEDKLKNVESPQERDEILRNRDRDQLSSYKRYIDVIAPLESFKNDPLIFEPNTDWAYSSLGYRVLACVLEGAAKKKYSDLMAELVFDRAGMINTVKDDAWEIISDRTTGYRLDRKKNIRRADMRDTSENLPAGGHLSTATDLVLFASHVNPQVFLSAKLMPKNQTHNTIGVESSWRNAIPSKELYGSGEMFFPDKSHLWIGHTGRIAGGSAIVILQPKNDLSIAVLTNAKGWNGYISFIDKLKLILEESSDLLK